MQKNLVEVPVAKLSRGQYVDAVSNAGVELTGKVTYVHPRVGMVEIDKSRTVSDKLWKFYVEEEVSYDARTR